MTPKFKDSLGVVFENLLVNLRHAKFSVSGTTFFRPVPNTLFLSADKKEKFSEMKIFYKETVRLIYCYSDELTASYFKLCCGWVKMSKKRKILYFYSTKMSSVCYTGITAPLSWRSVSMTTMVDRCSHTMRQKSFTVLAIGP